MECFGHLTEFQLSGNNYWLDDAISAIAALKITAVVSSNDSTVQTGHVASAPNMQQYVGLARGIVVKIRFTVNENFTSFTSFTK